MRFGENLFKFSKSYTISRKPDQVFQKLIRFGKNVIKFFQKLMRFKENLTKFMKASLTCPSGTLSRLRGTKRFGAQAPEGGGLAEDPRRSGSQNKKAPPETAGLLWFIYRARTYPRIAFRSASGVVMGLMLKVSTRKFSTFGVMNAGRLGPSLMFLIPR